MYEYSWYFLRLSSTAVVTLFSYQRLSEIETTLPLHRLKLRFCFGEKFIRSAEGNGSLRDGKIVQYSTIEIQERRWEILMIVRSTFE